jgi:hypothetical protein
LLRGLRHLATGRAAAAWLLRDTTPFFEDAAVYVARDALGARHPEDKETAVRRMERHGAEIVTTEMVVFEWLQTADNARFRQTIALFK